jgi:hypothetical protein
MAGLAKLPSASVNIAAIRAARNKPALAKPTPVIGRIPQL